MKLMNKSIRLHIIIYNYIKINLYKYIMNEFWNNISRYPRFFISSLAGLILVILTPFRNFFKIKKFQFIFQLFLYYFLLFCILFLANMTGL